MCFSVHYDWSAARHNDRERKWVAFEGLVVVRGSDRAAAAAAVFSLAPTGVDQQTNRTRLIFDFSVKCLFWVIKKSVLVVVVTQWQAWIFRIFFLSVEHELSSSALQYSDDTLVQWFSNNTWFKCVNFDSKMLLEIALWLIFGFILLWALIDPIHRVANAAWEILVPIFDSTPVELKTRFGEWAGNALYY